MSSQSLAVDQLIELLLQLKKTTPASAKQILNGQPQIAYALIALMVRMKAVNTDVFQKILSEYGRPSATPAATPLPSQAPTPVPALPPHMLHAQAAAAQSQQQQQYRNATPPYPYANGNNISSSSQNQGAFFNAQQQQQPQQQQQQFAPPGLMSSNYGYNQPQPSYAYPPTAATTTTYNTLPGSTPAPAPVAPTPPNASNNSTIPDMLASMADEQKALIMHIISLTPDQINAFPPAERQTYIQLRATLGIPT